LALSGSVRLLLRTLPRVLGDPWVVGEPLAQFGRVVLQAFDALAGLPGKVGCDRQAIVPAVAFEHPPGGAFELVGLTQEIGPRAALCLAGIGWQLDAVDGEHLAPDQPLAVAEVEHLGEQAGGFVA